MEDQLHKEDGITEQTNNKCDGCFGAANNDCINCILKEDKMDYGDRVVSVLGEDYKIEFKKERELSTSMDGTAGYTDYSVKKIMVVIPAERSNNMEDVDHWIKATLRHEITHAFFYESGLAENVENPDFGITETIVDWFAIQSPKMFKAFEQAGCLDVKRQNLASKIEERYIGKEDK